MCQTVNDFKSNSCKYVATKYAETVLRALLSVYFGGVDRRFESRLDKASSNPVMHLFWTYLRREDFLKVILQKKGSKYE